MRGWKQNKKKKKKKKKLSKKKRKKEEEEEVANDRRVERKETERETEEKHTRRTVYVWFVFLVHIRISSEAGAILAFVPKIQEKHSKHSYLLIKINFFIQFFFFVVHSKNWINFFFKFILNVKNVVNVSLCAWTFICVVYVKFFFVYYALISIEIIYFKTFFW